METPKLSGFAIRKYRLRRKKSQEAVAVAAGMNVKTLQRWEAGDVPKNPKPEWVEGLSKELRCDPEGLFVPGWRLLYEGVLLEVQDFLLIPADATDPKELRQRTLAVSRYSRELRQWQVFMETYKIDPPVRDAPSAAQLETERNADLLPEGVDPLAEIESDEDPRHDV